MALEELFLRAVVPVRVDADGVRAALTRELLRRLHEMVGHARAAPIGRDGVAVQHGGVVTVRAPASVRERVIGGVRRAAEREHGGNGALIREHMARPGHDVGAERVRVRVIALPLVDAVAAQVVARLLHNGEDGGKVVLRRGTADGRLRELRAAAVAPDLIEQALLGRCGRRFPKELRALYERALQTLPRAPRFNFGVIAAAQHLGHGAPLPRLGAGILRVLEPAQWLSPV